MKLSHIKIIYVVHLSNIHIYFRFSGYTSWTRLRLLVVKIQKALVNYNMFKSRSPDLHRVYQERVSTRVYLLLLVLCTIVFSINTFFTVQTTIVVVNSPTKIQYDALQASYPDSLQCPCEHVSVLYDTFIKFAPTFHQICFSHFVEYWYVHHCSLIF